MIRCNTCLYPDTKPDLPFVDGECAACRNYRNRPTVDWGARRRALIDIIADAEPNGSGYDCVVASSGGKDSHYQVLTLIELGARPLVVTGSTDLLTPIGRRNIDNLARYATTVEVTPNRTARAKLNRLGLELVGDISWPEHALIFSAPYRVAVAEGIPLIFYGENPQREYGGPAGTEESATMTRRWITEFGGFLGLRQADLVGRGKLSEADLTDYQLPVDGALEKVNAYFLGQFLPWDSLKNSEIAAAAGMIVPVEPPSEANWWCAENLDNAMTGLHDHAMYRKYGYGRFVAQISVDIRAGRVSRDHALKLAKAQDGIFPFVYAGVSIDEVLELLELTTSELLTMLGAHTNWGLFSHVELNRPILKGEAWC